jgi:hypothetical protein
METFGTHVVYCSIGSLRSLASETEVDDGFDFAIVHIGLTVSIWVSEDLGHKKRPIKAFFSSP